jgi:His-Xaa-Ser system protein HxsD
MKDIVELYNQLIFTVDSHLYSEDVIYKCFYWYGADYAVDIQREGLSFKIVLSSKSGEPIDTIVLCDKIRKDLVDFKLRDIVSKETKTIRELLTAKAFANYGMENAPITEISDPVGYDPTVI